MQLRVVFIPVPWVIGVGVLVHRGPHDHTTIIGVRNVFSHRVDNVVLIAHIQTLGNGQHLFAVAEIIIPVRDPHVPTFHVTVAWFVEVPVSLPHIKLQH